MMKNNLIIGAGITGITLARCIAEKGENVVVVEKRPHIGGNCYDYFDDDGNYVKPYGPHIFHTKHEDVYAFLSRFTKFKTYKHKVYAEVDEKLYTLPFNYDGIRQAFDKKTASRIISRLEFVYGKNKNVSILDLMKVKDDYYLKTLGDFVYEKIFLNYTLKQWDIKPEDISPEVTNRVPIFTGKSKDYFREDPYQGIPEHGFTSMFQHILNHKNITLMTNMDYNDLVLDTFDRVFVTSPIDEFFKYKYGKLKYRRISIVLEKKLTDKFQSNSVINHPNANGFTRITEFNHFLKVKSDSTVIGTEYPSWEKGFLAYPVLTPENHEIYEKYKVDADAMENTFFVGRLAEYKYLNIDICVKHALKLIEDIEWSK